MKEPLPEIQLSSLAYTAMHWLPREDYDPFDLDAPYQRGSVWTVEQRQALIKSLLMGLPIGAIIISALPYTEKRKGSVYRVIDGKQRVETIRAFANDEFGIPRWWLQPDYIGERFSCPDDTNGDGDCGKRYCPYCGNEASLIRWSGMSQRAHRRFEMGTMMPALEFNAEREIVGKDAKGRWIFRNRSEAEMLQAEAEIYGLINGGGTAQTPEDMARAASIAAPRHTLDYD